VHTALFSGWFSSPYENLPEQHFLSTASNVFCVLKSFVQYVLVENCKDVLFNTCQKFVKVVVEQFSRVDHCDENFVFNSQQLFKDVHFLVDQNILEQDDVVGMLSFV
jgi:hypothetical protein